MGLSRRLLEAKRRGHLEELIPVVRQVHRPALRCNSLFRRRDGRSETLLGVPRVAVVRLLVRLTEGVGIFVDLYIGIAINDIDNGCCVYEPSAPT